MMKRRASPSGGFVSTNVRRQSFLQNLQRVDSSRVVVNFRTAAAPVPTNVVRPWGNVDQDGPGPARERRSDGRADRPALSRVGVDEDAGAGDLRPDEIGLRLDGRQVVLGPALEDERPAELRQVRLLDDVEPDVLRQDPGHPRQDLLLLPPELLEVHDVRFQENGASVGEDRKTLGPEGGVGEIGDGVPEPLRRGLEEVAVSGGALRIEPEVLDRAVLEEDHLDVLAAHVHDHVGVGVVVEGRLGVGHRLHDGDVGQERLLEHVLGVSRRPHAADDKGGPLRPDLPVKVAEDLARVV